MVEGSCLCGSIKYEVELIPEKIFNHTIRVRPYILYFCQL